MDWVLARMLRDAGFPQFPRHEQAVNPENAGDIATAPTLNQVVEASGHHLRALINAKRIWYAVGDQNVSEGKTPRDAVARLWLRHTLENPRQPGMPGGA